MGEKSEGQVPQYEVAFEPCKRQGNETVKIHAKDRSVYLHSRYDPEAEAEKLAAKLIVGPDTVYFIFGLGMGYHIKALLARMGADNRIVVFEPNSALLEAFTSRAENRALLDDERAVFLQYKSKNAANAVLEGYYKFATSFQKNRMFILPPYKELYPKECEEFSACVNAQVTRCFLIKNTKNIFSDIWFKSTLDNIGFLRKSWSGAALEGLYAGVPAIIVSAGPSLSKNIEHLAKASEKAVIIAVDTAYRPLYNKGIMPDYVVTVDAQPLVVEKFNGTDIFETDLVTTYLSSTSVQKKHTGRIAAFREFNCFLDECYDQIGIRMIELDNDGGSVACAALDLAYKTGANPIIFIGQDLAHTGGESHVEGAAYYYSGDLALHGTFEVEGINGGTVPTTYSLNRFREWIQMYISVNGGRTYINATEGGAKIEGTEAMTLSEACGRFCLEKRDIAEKKERVFAKSNRCVTRKQYEEFIGHIERAGKYLKRIVKDVDICKALTEKMIKEVDTFGFKRPERILAPYQKIKKLNKDLDKNEHYVDIILPLMAMQREETARTDHLLDNSLSEAQLLSNDLKKYADYYRVFSEKAKYAIPQIEEAVLREKKELENIQKNNLEEWKDE